MKIYIRESDNPRRAKISIGLSKKYNGTMENCDGEIRSKTSSSINIIKRRSENIDESFIFNIASTFKDEYSETPRTKISQCSLTHEELTELKNQIEYILNY